MAKSKNANSKQCPGPGEDTDDGSGHHAAYSDHSNTLRSWLVAYGIGGPVLILSQDTLWGVLAKSGLLQDIALWFLLGVSIQVALAAINKSVMWVCYYGGEEPKFKKTIRYKMADWLSKQYWIDLSCDLIAIAAFVWATYLCFISLVAQSVT